MPTITYLDYNATTPVRPEVQEVIMRLLGSPHNPSSVHFYGREAKKHLENSRETLAQALNCWANEVIFTSCGTEANTLMLRGFEGRRLLISSVEHSSIHKTVGNSAERIAVDANGVVKLDALETLLKSANTPALVSVMLANNETGVIQPIAEVARIAKAHGALVHTDAAQALGKIPTDFSSLGVDMMTVSAHKLGGAPGAAALILRNDLPIKPLLTGGGQELGRRAGTENVAAIAGFAKAVELAQSADAHQKMQALRTALDALEARLLKAVPSAKVHGAEVVRLPNTTCISMPGVVSETQLMAFDLAGIAVSAGSACSSGKIEASHVLTAMGLPKELASTAIRISGGWGTDAGADLAKLEKAWIALYERVGKKVE